MISADTSAAQRAGLFFSLEVQSLRLVSQPSAAALRAEMFHFVDPIHQVFVLCCSARTHPAEQTPGASLHILYISYRMLASRLMANVSVVYTNGLKIKGRLKYTVAERKREGNVK